MRKAEVKVARDTIIHRIKEVFALSDAQVREEMDNQFPYLTRLGPEDTLGMRKFLILYYVDQQLPT